MLVFVTGNAFGETEFELNCWKVGVIFLEVTLRNKSSWIIWVVLKRTDR